MLDLTALLVFAGALFVAAASPGPGIAAIVARVLGRGPGGAVAFSAGVAIGDIVRLAFAVAGLAVLAQSFYPVFVTIKYAGAAYLLYLAWKLWTAPVVATPGEGETKREGRLRLFLGGLAVTMGNPKVMVFYLALLPNLIDLGSVSFLGYAELALVTQLVLAVVFAAYILLAPAQGAFLAARAPCASSIAARGP